MTSDRAVEVYVVLEQARKDILYEKFTPTQLKMINNKLNEIKRTVAKKRAINYG